MALIVTSPDYHMQGVLIEVLYRYVSTISVIIYLIVHRVTRRDRSKWSPLFEDEDTDDAFWRITGRNFRGVRVHIVSI